MSVTIMEILKNADYNLGTGNMWHVTYNQLHNTVTLLNKDYGLYDTVDVNALADQYGSLEAVPEREEL